MQPPLLKYGVVHTGTALKAWQASCIDRLERSGTAQLLWIDSRAPVQKKNTAYERFCATLHLPSQQPMPAPLVAQQGSLQDLDVDFILFFGDAASARDLGGKARYGGWRFALGDAPGFWEIYDNRDVTSAQLVKIGAAHEQDVVLKSGHFATIRESLAQNVEVLFDDLAEWPAQVCRDIARGATSFSGNPTSPEAVHRGAPNALQIAAFRVIQAKNAAARYLRGQLCSIDWDIFALKGRPADFIGRDAAAEVTRLCDYQKNRFRADPCIVEEDSRRYVFFEEYNYEQNRGRIAAIEVQDGRACEPRTAIQEAYHLSFPQVFRHDGAFFCINETAAVQTLDLYRAIEFPYRWSKVHTLLQNVRAVDTVLLRHQDKWWLFCTSGKGPRQGDYSHLHIWYADDLFGTWTPHARNPVKIDARSARPAGAFFVHDGHLYRPTQDCSRTYGGAIRLNRIDKLSEAEFEETVVGRIRPPSGRYNRGIHTLSCAGDRCIVDAKRYVFNPSGIVAIAKDLVKAVARAAGVTLRRQDARSNEFVR